MKKMNILIMLAVLLLAMTQTASAVTALTEFEDGCYCVNLAGEYELALIPASASVQMLSVPTTYYIEVDAKVCKSGEDITVTIIDSNPAVEITNLNIISLYKENIVLNASGVCEMGYQFEGMMTLVGDGEQYTSTSATGLIAGQIPVIGEFAATIEECNVEEIPEFPTIVLPVAAILGLAFFMQRRKE
ncbi:PEF-CTERM sorting domain-containing protein [Methanolobus sp.]|uniref:PEF-CTERM sorting domain-containing protein n=1 Tax=Methanolobus sp. TaxID=1874737 RepID=UPI0025F0BA9A|nr:PEF-CTERM sorting domain-containing protein [Methanolobus sp.]